MKFPFKRIFFNEIMYMTMIHALNLYTLKSFDTSFKLSHFLNNMNF